jgi:FMN phosphatase YigB (HAD superfamily)
VTEGVARIAAPAVQMVCFDIGETLVDETEVWGSWADRLEVPRLTFFATLGAVIERGGDHLEVFEAVRPGFPLTAALDAAAHDPDGPGRFGVQDLYPDVAPAFEALRQTGYRLAIAGNQPERAEAVLREAELPVEFVASSASWGVEKPSPAFFARLSAEAGLSPAEIAYVGDRVDNDVVPAADAGFVSVFIRRGPWGVIQSSKPGVERAALQIESLNDLLPGLSRLAAAGVS